MLGPEVPISGLLPLGRPARDRAVPSVSGWCGFGPVTGSRGGGGPAALCGEDAAEFGQGVGRRLRVDWKAVLCSRPNCRRHVTRSSSGGVSCS